MKKQVDQYIADKQSCPAKAYRHPEGQSFCYQKTFWGGKSSGLRGQVPICDESADYCQWKKGNETTSSQEKHGEGPWD